jgi:large subunit ribosomal protein L6
MSRIGRAPIAVPQGVKVEIGADNSVTVSGPNGTLTKSLHPALRIVQAEGELSVERPNDDRDMRSLHGLTRALLNNMVVGVTTGHRRTLLITGIGFRAEQIGRAVNLQAGFSHPVLVYPDDGLEVKVETANRIVVSGADKELVGDLAAKIRAVRKVKPYIFRGDFQGIRYEDERPRRKAGKQGV